MSFREQALPQSGKRHGNCLAFVWVAMWRSRERSVPTWSPHVMQTSGRWPWAKAMCCVRPLMLAGVSPLEASLRRRDRFLATLGNSWQFLAYMRSKSTGNSAPQPGNRHRGRAGDRLDMAILRRLVLRVFKVSGMLLRC